MLPTMPSTGLVYENDAPLSATPYLRQPVMAFAGALGSGLRVLDVGCGNGYWAAQFSAHGCSAVGIDPSTSGISVARDTYPDIRFECMEASADLLEQLGERPFDIVVSTEVVEHLYDPAAWAAGCYGALRPGGKLILSTPYHGWLKNVAIAVANKSDFHHNPLRVGGHIKFFSNKALTLLLQTAGFRDEHFVGVGRIPFMWRSVVVCATRPAIT